MGQAKDQRSDPRGIIARITGVFRRTQAPPYSTADALYSLPEGAGNGFCREDEAAIGYESSWIALFPRKNTLAAGSQDFNHKGG